MRNMSEREIRALSGWLMLVVLIVVLAAALYGVIAGARDGNVSVLVPSLVVIVVGAVCFNGLTVVNPNEARVLTLFGVYKGSIKHAGFWWVNPLTSRRRLSLRVRNFERAS
jgi:Na+-driven multidrug efflux pump